MRMTTPPAWNTSLHAGGVFSFTFVSSIPLDLTRLRAWLDLPVCRLNWWPRRRQPAGLRVVQPEPDVRPRGLRVRAVDDPPAVVPPVGADRVDRHPVAAAGGLERPPPRPAA